MARTEAPHPTAIKTGDPCECGGKFITYKSKKVGKMRVRYLRCNACNRKGKETCTTLVTGVIECPCCGVTITTTREQSLTKEPDGRSLQPNVLPTKVLS